MEYVGKTYTVKDLRVRSEKDGGELTVSGSFDVIEYEGEDREVGIFGSYYVLVPTGTDGTDASWEAVAVTVHPDLLIEQIDPERAKREAELEAQMEEAAQMEAADVVRRSMGLPPDGSAVDPREET